jgi:hypothetical protein
MSDLDILTELRAWRDEFARSHGYDLGAMAAALRELDEAAGVRVVRGQPRRPEAVLPRGAGAPNPALHRIPAAGGVESREGLS